VLKTRFSDEIETGGFSASALIRTAWFELVGFRRVRRLSEVAEPPDRAASPGVMAGTIITATRA
jgi:hypothetical protein